MLKLPYSASNERLYLRNDDRTIEGYKEQDRCSGEVSLTSPTGMIK